MSGKVEIAVSSSFDDRGLRAAETELDRFKRLVADHEERNRRAAAEFARLQRESRTGNADDSAAQHTLQRLEEEARRATELAKSYGIVMDRKREIVRQQSEYEAQGKPLKAYELQPELEAISHAIKHKGRDPYLVDADMQRQLARYDKWRTDAEAERIKNLESMYGKGEWQPITPGWADIPEPPAPSWWSRNRGPIGRFAGQSAMTIGGLAFLEAMRGMPAAEDEAKLRYQVGAPRARSGMGVDEFGKEVAEVGRAMQFTRQATLQAAEAYSQVAGRLGRQLTPELEEVARASRYYRMELTEGAQFFGQFRRQTREDDPQALHRIITTVRAAYEAQGSRRDEILPTLKMLAERAAQGRPEGINIESIQVQDALLRLLGRTGLPGFQGAQGGQVIQGMFNMGFNTGDMTDVTRYMLLTGQRELLRGNPFDVKARAGLQLEHFARGDVSKEELSLLFNAFRNAPTLTGARTDLGQAQSIKDLLRLQLSLDQIVKLREAGVIGGDMSKFERTWREMAGQRPGDGPEADQLHSDFMQDETTKRSLRDSMSTLGRGLLDARNSLMQSASNAAGGGTAGDFAALGVDMALTGTGAYAGYRTARSLMGFGRAATRLRGPAQAAVNYLSRGVGGAGRLLGSIPGLRTLGHFGEASLEAIAAAFPEIAIASRVAGRAALPLAAAVGAVDTVRVIHGSYKLYHERASAADAEARANQMASRTYHSQDEKFLDRLKQYQDPEQVAEAQRLYREQRMKDRQISEVGAGYWDFFKWWGKPATGKGSRTEHITPGGAMDYVEREMEKRYGTQLPETEVPSVDDLHGSATETRQREVRHNGSVNVNINLNLNGNQSLAEMGRAVGEQIAEPVADAIKSIYEPLYSSWSVNGRTA